MDELLLLSLSTTELRTLLALKHLADKDGKIKATMEDLGEVTNYGRESLRIAMRGLEARGVIATHRTKRNLGRLYKNEYLIFPKNLASEIPEKLASTADTSNTSKSGSTLVKNTTYSLESSALENEIRKEVEVVNKWQDDDDNIGGWGLLDGDKISANRTKPLSKRSPKNRHQRPQEEWTAADVASEFSKRLYEKITGVPAIVNTDRLRAVLATYRKRYGTTALTELEVLEMFFGDNRILYKVRKEPHNAWRVFLRMLTTRGQEALENLGMDEDLPDELDNESPADYVYASDGKKFDNSMPGRKAMERYEEELGRH